MNKSSSTRSRRVSPIAQKRISELGSKNKLLLSAEMLFSSKGFREVSVREISAHAGVNCALVAYYFGGKQALFNEVFRSHAVPLAQDRMKRLKAITQNGQKPLLEEILEAWLLPWFHLGNDQKARTIHPRIIANLAHERWEYTQKVSNYMQRSLSEFIKALQSCLPYLSKETLLWRLHFAIGALVFGIRQPAPLIALSGGRCNPDDLEATFSQILPFVVAGFRARETGCNRSRKRPPAKGKS
jgi:AcrR family transcriptional regulator